MAIPPIPVALGYALQWLVAFRARDISKARPAHVPFFVLPTYVALVDPLRWPLTQERLSVGHGHPYEGWTLAGWHIDRAMCLGWPTGLAAVSWAVFAGRAAWPHLLGVLGLWTAIGTVAYPALASRLVLASLHLAALICALVPAAMRLRVKRWPSETERIIAAYLIAECVAWPLLYLIGDRQMGSRLSWGVYLSALGYAIVSQAMWKMSIKE